MSNHSSNNVEPVVLGWNLLFDLVVSLSGFMILALVIWWIIFVAGFAIMASKHEEGDWQDYVSLHKKKFLLNIVLIPVLAISLSIPYSRNILKIKLNNNADWDKIEERLERELPPIINLTPTQKTSQERVDENARLRDNAESEKLD